MSVRGTVNTLLRYAIAAIGPIGSAGAQFVLSLVLLRLLDQHAFGSFSFLLIASIFSWGLSSALLCAPMPILLSRGDAASRDSAERCLIAMNLLGAMLAFVVFWALGVALAVPGNAAVIFAAYSAVALMRWFARAHAYASGAQLRTMSSDLVYSASLVIGVALVWWAGRASLDLAYAVLLASAVLAMLPFGRRYLVAQFLRVSPAALRSYGAIWREHSGWSLVGVITTEATANAHVYIVTGFFGPAAFAPIAASALMIRPIGVAQNALSEFERAQMARQIGQSQIEAAISSVRTFRLALMGAWVVTAIAVGAMLLYAPRLIFPHRYDLHFLVVGAVLWMGVAGMRLLRAPESALLQAAGAFRPLAFASVLSCGFSVGSVLLLLALFGPLWSILGILVGESVFAIWTWVQSHRWRRAARAEAQAHDRSVGVPA